MFTSRNIVTVLLILGVGALGWVGGSRFTLRDELPEVHGQKPAHEEKDEHAGHGHAEKQDEHAGHAQQNPGRGQR